MQGIRGTTRKSCYRLKVLCKSRHTIASWITSKDSCAIALTLDSHRFGLGLRIANRRSVDEAFKWFENNFAERSYFHHGMLSAITR